MRHPGIYIQQVEGKGRGVFTAVPLPPETILEKSPVILITEKERQQIDDTLLHDYIFEWTPENQTLCAMALGWIPLYNHAKMSNCEYFMDYDTNEIYIQTVRKIEAGEELSINYNGSWNNEDAVWFEKDLK